MKLTEFREIGQELLEFRKGAKIFGSSYVQRLGTPGHYTYIYPAKHFIKFGRKFNRIYSRYIRRNSKLFKSLGNRYEASSMNLKPKTWTHHILTMKTRHKGIMDFKLNLRTHTVSSYRSRLHSTGGASRLAMMKRKGILRYR